METTANSLTVPAGKIYVTPHPGPDYYYLGETDGAEIERSPEVEERWQGVGSQVVLADVIPVSAATVITVKCLEARDGPLGLGLMAYRDTATPGQVRLYPRADLATGAIVALTHVGNPVAGRSRTLRVMKTLVLPDGPIRLKRTAQGDELQVVELRFRVLYAGPSSPDWWFEEVVSG